MSNLNTGNIIDPSNPNAVRPPAWFVGMGARRDAVGRHEG